MSASPGFHMAALFAFDAKIEEIGEEFGADGPYAIVVLLGQARVQARGGRVEWSLRALATTAFLSNRGRAAQVIQAAGKAGVVEVLTLDERSFAVRFIKWDQWQDRWRKAVEGGGSQRKSPEGSGSQRKKKSDALPSDSPPQQVLDVALDVAVEPETQTPKYTGPPAPECVLRAVAAVADSKPNSRAVKPHLLGKACADFSDRDVEGEADRFEGYWIDGAGEHRKLKDVCMAWRNWLRNAPRASRAAGPRRSKLRAKLDRLDELAKEVA